MKVIFQVICRSQEIFHVPEEIFTVICLLGSSGSQSTKKSGKNGKDDLSLEQYGNAYAMYLQTYYSTMRCFSPYCGPCCCDCGQQGGSGGGKKKRSKR